MGRMKFHVSDLDRFDAKIWNSAYVTGIEGIPWEGRNSIQGGVLCIDRPISESGKLSMVWPVQDHGFCTLTTGTLRTDDQVYETEVEFARGTLHRVKGRLSDWQRMGLKVPDAANESLQEASEAFIDAVLARSSAPEKCSQFANRSIAASMRAEKPLCRAFVSQSIQYRLQQEKQLSTLLAVQLDTHSLWKQDILKARPAMNTAIITPSWHIVQSDVQSVPWGVFDEQFRWAQEEGLRTIVGPLVSLQPWTIQNWVHLLKDFSSIRKAARDFVVEAVTRYRGMASIWNVATGLNAPNDLGLSDEEYLQFAIDVIQAVRQTDPRTPVILTIDMPWGEYLGRSTQAINPFPFADSLIRAQLGLSGIGLEINHGYWPGGTLPRDLIDFSDLIDYWSLLGVPLVASISSPCPAAVHTGATTTTESVFDKPVVSPQTITKAQDIAFWTSPYSMSVPSIQPSAHALDIMQMLLAKQNVHALAWTQLSDRSPCRFPDAGLLTREGESKQILEGLIQLRTRHGQ
jgi:hypothetical protein